MKLLRALIANHPLANILFFVVIITGAVAYFSLPREQDPEVNFNWVNISTPLPGASAEDVESRVTNPLEDAVRQVQDVRFVVSSSREGVSNILVRFDDIGERNFDKRVNDLRRELQNKANTELPAEALDPDIFEVTSSNGFPTATVFLQGTRDDELLRSTARQVQQDLDRIAGVDRVLALGFHDPELLVEFDPAKLSAHGLNAAQLSDTLRPWFRDVFAGKLDANDGEWLVRVSGTSEDPADLAGFSMPGANGVRVRLDQLAQVYRGRDTPRQLAGSNGQPGVLITVSKANKVNMLELVDRINEYVAEKNQVLASSGLKLFVSDDQSVPTRTALGVMQSNATVGLILVLAVCWLFLGSRIAFMVALGVVFSIAGTFIVLSQVGFTLNISVLLGIVIVLGMLVDDVVVVEAMYYRMQRGMDAMHAAIESLQEVGTPVLAAVLTTMAAFLPLMLLPGILGKFMFVIPLVVTVGLAVSLVEAIWMLPAHVTTMGASAIRSSRSQKIRERATHWVRVNYTRWLISVLRKPGRYLLTALLLFVGSLIAAYYGAVHSMGPLKFEFFAFDPIRVYYVNLDMPAKSAIEDTLSSTMDVEQLVRDGLREGEARSVVSVAGVKFTDIEPKFGNRYGQVIVSLNPDAAEMRSYDEILASIDDATNAYRGDGEISYFKLTGGPPAGRDFSVKVRGDNDQELFAAAEAVKQIVRGFPGASNITDDRSPGRNELSLEVDVDAARKAGLEPGMVARLIRLHLDGEIIADLRDAGEKLELRVRGLRQSDHDVRAILNDPITLPSGRSMPLGNLVRASERRSAGIIHHWNLRRSISIEADLDSDQISTDLANRRLVEEWQNIRTQHPNADLDFSGVLDDILESQRAMGPFFLLGIGLIYIILAAQFKSYFQPLMILTTVFLALTGVTLGLIVSRNPMSLFTMYGTVALMGIAVNAAIVLISAANDRVASGMRVLHATVYAARRRVIAILITTGTTIAGLFSLAVGLGGKSLIWGPVAASIVWGLAFSTALTLLVIPVLYRLFMQQGGIWKVLKPYWHAFVRMISRLLGRKSQPIKSR